jgi:hypothetical protein
VRAAAHRPLAAQRPAAAVNERIFMVILLVVKQMGDEWRDKVRDGLRFDEIQVSTR